LAYSFVPQTHEDLYRAGGVGDVIKRKLIEVLNDLLGPIRSRRKYFETHPEDVLDALRLGTERAIAVAEETNTLAKRALRQDYFERRLALGGF
jgi:tryptophanyl-tRNA synthetase